MWGKGRRMATELGMVHYESAAQGLGANGELVERAEDIAPAMKRALASGRAPPASTSSPTRDVVEPGTLAMYSAGLSGPAKEKPKPDAGGETTLPYYGKRKLD